MKKSLLLFISGCLAFTVILSGTSCQKDTDCKATVKCVDSLDAPVAGADVFLYAGVESPDGKTTYTGDVTASGTTAGDGTVQFVFKLPAIFDIRATKIIGTNTITGVGIIKLEEGKTVDKTVTLKKPD